jgi:hypothetical protein
MGVDYAAVADPLLKTSLVIAKQHRQAQQRLDAFAMKACIDSLQRELSNVELVVASLQAITTR